VVEEIRKKSLRIYSGSGVRSLLRKKRTAAAIITTITTTAATPSYRAVLLDVAVDVVLVVVEVALELEVRLCPDVVVGGVVVVVVVVADPAVTFSIGHGDSIPSSPE
jgi:hypothetical protein